MKRIFLSLLFLPAFAFASVSGMDDMNPNISSATQAKLDTAVTTYYQHPSIQKVDTVLDIMTGSEVLRKKTAWPPFVGFLTVVFAHNKDHVMQWLSRNDYNMHAQDVIIEALLHAKLKEDALIFAKGEQWEEADIEKLRQAQDKVDLKKLSVILPGHIDTLWGAFFGSGDAVYVREIIEVLFMTSLPSSPDVAVPPGYDMLAENKKLAETTLRQYAAQHKPVRDIIRATMAEEKSSGHKALLKQLLPHSP